MRSGSFRQITEDLSFCVSGLELFFRFEPDWHKTEVVRAGLLRYYAVLRRALRTTPKRHRVLARCRTCGIFFSPIPGIANEKTWIACWVVGYPGGQPALGSVAVNTVGPRKEGS
jgi:hypothetical protein